MAEDYSQALLGNADVQKALEKLNKLTGKEHLAIAARTLVVAEEIKVEVGAGMTGATLRFRKLLIAYLVRENVRKTGDKVERILELSGKSCLQRAIGLS
jgi:hypothetical protein